MSSTSFWPTYAQSASAQNWFRCDSTNTGTVTAASGSGSTVTYTAFNNFTAGDNVTISGLGIFSGKSLNLVNVTIATANPASFTVTNATVGISNGTGSAYRTIVPDKIAANNGTYMGTVSFPLHGAMIYSTDGCVDTANGGSTSTGYVRLPVYSSALGGVDFWILGQRLAGTDPFECQVTISSVAYPAFIQVTLEGYLAFTALGVGTVTSTVKIDDGYWHHVGLISDSSGYLHLYVDGTFISLSGIGNMAGFQSVGSLNLAVGSIGPVALGNSPAYFDEIIISNRTSLATLSDEVRNRYRAGTLLQLPTNPAGTQVLSGDRIAEVLLLAGFGTITAGAIVLNANTYFINDGSAWVNGTSGNGFIHVEPWYWDTPVTTTTALDLISQITDSDIGTFYQKPDGTFNFFNQNFYGTWAWSGSSGTWTPSYTTPSGNHVWTDDQTSVYNYDPTSLQVIRDDADTWTMVEITPQAGTMQTYENTGGEARWGYSVLTKASTVHPTLNLALSTANFLGHLFRSPLPRVQAVELRAETNNGSNITALIGSLPGDPVTFVRTSPNASTSGTYPDQRGQVSTNMVIESIHHDFNADPGFWRTTFVLDPYPIRT
jgi:hypothetical protein